MSKPIVFKAKVTEMAKSVNFKDEQRRGLEQRTTISGLCDIKVAMWNRKRKRFWRKSWLGVKFDIRSDNTVYPDFEFPKWCANKVVWLDADDIFNRLKELGWER